LVKDCLADARMITPRRALPRRFVGRVVNEGIGIIRGEQFCYYFIKVTYGKVYKL